MSIQSLAQEEEPACAILSLKMAVWLLGNDQVTAEQLTLFRSFSDEPQHSNAPTGRLRGW